MKQTELTKIINHQPKLSVKFFQQQASDSEPVGDWLKSSPLEDRKVIGEDIIWLAIGFAVN